MARQKISHADVQKMVDNLVNLQNTLTEALPYLVKDKNGKYTLECAESIRRIIITQHSFNKNSFADLRTNCVNSILRLVVPKKVEEMDAEDVRNLWDKISEQEEENEK